jgi:hypothetical protein
VLELAPENHEVAAQHSTFFLKPSRSARRTPREICSKFTNPAALISGGAGG